MESHAGPFYPAVFTAAAQVEYVHSSSCEQQGTVLGRPVFLPRAWRAHSTEEKTGDTLPEK